MFNSKLKIGLFGFNVSSGVTLTKQKKRWMPNANWEKIKKVVQFADKNGIDFLIPLARWNDLGGITRPHKETFEIFSLISALSVITKNIFLFSTLHTIFINPVFAARAVTTISKISGGRFGVNVVCGWNKTEYEMFNIIKGNLNFNRYEYAQEWMKIFNKLINKNYNLINFNGKHLKTKNAQCFPKIYNEKKFLKISAAFSDDGRKFAINNCDILLTMFSNLETLKSNNLKLINKAKKSKKKIKIYSPIHLIVKSSRQEAIDFYEEYSVKNRDIGATNKFINNLGWANKSHVTTYMKQVKKIISGSSGSYTIAGNRKDALEQIYEIYKSKINGIALSFFDYDQDLKYFIKHLFPDIKRF